MTPPAVGPALRRGVAVAALLVLVATGCEGAPDPGPPEPTAEATAEAPQGGGERLLLLDFDTAEVGSPLGRAGASTGRASVDPVTSGDGAVLADDAGPSGTAARFPTATETATGSRAVLRVTPEGADTLAPGEQDFRFGVDVALGDPDDPGAAEDGDNLVQRGLFGNAGQYKLQVDQGRASCRVAGVAGAVIVRARAALESGAWHRLLCERTADGLTLFVGELDEEGAAGAWRSWSEPGETGDIPSDDPAPPLSVGGKLNAGGGLVLDAPDQFNGTLDNVVVELLAP